MREFVGVKSGFDVLVNRSLKREALMFDRVAVPELDSILQPEPVHLTEDTLSLISQLEWLLEKNIIYQPDKPLTDPRLLDNDEYITSIKEKFDIDKDLEDLIGIGVGRENPLVKELFLSAEYLTVRYTAIQLRELCQTDAYPVFYTDPLTTLKAESIKNDIVKIVLNTLPVPDETTSWEQIIEYRSDPDSRNKFLDLRHWMSEVARGEYAPAEVEEKIEYQISQYQRHMAVHQMKANTGTLETIITTSAEMLGDLLSFKWGKAAKSLFSLRRRTIALIEGELNSPGNEVAYVVKARETFKS